MYPSRKEDDFVTIEISYGNERDAAAVICLAKGANLDIGLKL